MNEETDLIIVSIWSKGIKIFSEALRCDAALERQKLVKSKTHSINYMNTERDTTRERNDRTRYIITT